MNIDLSLISKNFSNVEFFVACVFPSQPSVFNGGSTDLSVTTSADFWAISSRSPASSAGLVHNISENLVIFRGYEVSTGAHSYSPTPDLARIAVPENLKNGAFAYLKFDPLSQTLMIKSDGFGIGPLFYRQDNGAWLFASHPSLLHLASDSPDLIGWASLMQNGYIFGDGTFYSDIKRFPAGTEMLVSRLGYELNSWFDFSKLPEGRKAVDEDAVHAIENAYCTAMERCLNLKVGDVALPFSSGFDSRRFFATMVRKKVDFRAVTCQSYNRKKGRDYDIDSVYAPKIAAAFGVDCEVVSAGSAEQMEIDSVKRQLLIGTETFMHKWAMPLMRWLSERPPSLIFDGLAGDVFGNSSFDIEGLDGNAQRSAEEIVERATKPHIFQHLSLSSNSAADYRKKYREFISKFSSNMNQSQLSFFQARTRRAIAPWITMMHPPGHVVVFPYCDIDFAVAALMYDPGEKYKRYLQRECLQRFYPEFYDFASSRNLPSTHLPVDVEVSLAHDRAEEKTTYGDSSIIFAACRYLSLPNKALLLFSQIIPILRRRRDWIFRPILTILRTQRQSCFYISLNAPVERKHHWKHSVAFDTEQSEAELV